MIAEDGPYQLHDKRVEMQALVQAMHDSVCRCGEQCRGYWADYADFVNYVETRWGHTAPMEWYLEGLKDDS